MRKRDAFDVYMAIFAVITDAAGIFGAFLLAWWIRFDSGWIPVDPDKGVPPADLYIYGGAVATILFLFIYGSLDLYRRPQTGSFVEKIPRLVRANVIGLFMAFALASIVRTEPPFSRLTVVIAFLTTCYMILLLRFILFQFEITLARIQTGVNRVAILGTDRVAYRLRQALEHDPRLRSRVIGFFAVNDRPPEGSIPPNLIRGDLDAFEDMVNDHAFDELILTDPSMSHERMVEIIGLCERNLVNFHLVPDLFRLLTSTVAVQNIGGIPLLGVGRWPLDHTLNRLAKRTMDIAGAGLGLLATAPLLAALMVLIKRESPGPAIYRQERCGEQGRPFTLYKLRSMPIGAEDASGPVWTSADDKRRTRLGAWMRASNLDELPQLWNVLKGEMSLVGPRPERPHFVEQFKEDIGEYMWRHVYKPGMTGWAQVNGLRGDTDLRERIKHDLYYLENWSLAYDFKILLRTLFSRDNAY